jgi:hypothetical protein
MPRENLNLLREEYLPIPIKNCIRDVVFGQVVAVRIDSLPRSDSSHIS